MIPNRFHSAASDVLRTQILARMADDPITSAAIHDELVIIYGNMQALKYSASSHNFAMIRHKMRHIARLRIEAKKIDPTIDNVTAMFNPKKFDAVIKAIHRLGELREDGHYGVPSMGPSSITLLTQICELLCGEAIKRDDAELERSTSRFLILLKSNANAMVNKRAIESRAQLQRQKQVKLPKDSEVEKLNRKLEDAIRRLLPVLRLDFDRQSWIELSKIILIKWVTFNRKRPGDVEKISLAEYNNAKFADSNHISKTNESDREIAKRFCVLVTRGKINNLLCSFRWTIDWPSIYF